MRPRAIIATAAVAAASLAALGTGAASAQAATTCTWGGTPAEPTGSVYYTGGQGPTNTPSTEPLPFVATGPLAENAVGSSPTAATPKPVRRARSAALKPARRGCP